MSRTIGERGWFQRLDKESPWFRRWTVRKYRARCKQLIREGRYEMPPFKKTEGMLTW